MPHIHGRPMLASLNRKIARDTSLVSALILLAACDGATEPIRTATLRVATNIEAISPTTLVGTIETDVSQPPTVRVTDQFRDAVRDIEVFFWTIRYNGVPAHTSVRTGPDGIASAPWRLDLKAGSQTLRVVLAGQSYTSSSAVVFTATANAGAPASVRAVTNSLVTIRGSLASLRARVADGYNNPVSGVLVSFAIESGTGSLSSSSAHTDSLGIASVAWTLGAGDNSVIATVPGLAPARFAATILDAPVYYELTSMDGWGLLTPSWIELGVDGQFTTSVKGVEGTGQYTIADGEITFAYSTDFPARLSSTFDWWVYPYSSSETGTLTDDTLVLRRCWNEDCYEANWTFQRRAR